MDTIDVTTRYSVADITTPKATNTQSTIIRLAEAWVETVDILFAPGHAALTGVRLVYGGNIVLPWDGVGAFIAGDNERLRFVMGMYMPGPITIVTHNNDTLPHRHLVTFGWHTYTDAGVGPLAPVPLVVV